MNMMEAVKSVFSQYANFKGRARRSEYWYFCLFNILVGFVLGFLGSLTGISIFNAIASLYTLASLIPGLAVCVRRLHDMGKRGTWLFLVLIPIIGSIILIVWYTKDSVPGENEFGPNPKEASFEA